MITDKIKILHLEDQVMDVYLVKKILERSALDYTLIVVADKAAFNDAISNNTFDVVLADHSLPQFTAMDALAILKEIDIDIPFILVTGTVSEEFSVNAMKEGACDYILKDRLQRLPNAISGAIEKHHGKRERKQYLDEVIRKEALMKQAEQLARFGSWQSDHVTGISTWSDEQYRMLGYEPGGTVPSFAHYIARVHPDDLKHVEHLHEYAFEHLDSLKYECRIIGPGGVIKHVYSELVIKRNASREVTMLNGFMQDITERSMAKQELEDSEKKYRYLFEHSAKPTWVLDAETHRFLDVNNAAIQHYGHSYDEFMAMTSIDILPDTESNDMEIHGSRFSGAQHANTGLKKHRRKDGVVFDVSLLEHNVSFEGRPARLVLVTDVAAKK